MTEESLHGERSPVPEVTLSDGGSACAAERGRSPSGAEHADPPSLPAAGSTESDTVDGSAVTPAGDEWGVDVDIEKRPRLTGPLLPPLARGGQHRKKSLSKPVSDVEALKPEQRLLILDTWLRSGLPAGDFGALVGISKHTLYAWKKRFEEQGPGGLMDKPKGGPRGSKLSDLTKRTILMLKQANPSWGCQRISDMLVRGPGLSASPSAVATVLHDAGYPERRSRREPSQEPDTE
jgi:transposase